MLRIQYFSGFVRKYTTGRPGSTNACGIKAGAIWSEAWYVSGQAWVGSCLIDTGDGLILIDTGIPESLYLLVNSIYQLGHGPSDVRMILLSHAHFDHLGAAEAPHLLTGAPLYLSREDEEFLRSFPDKEDAK